MLGRRVLSRRRLLGGIVLLAAGAGAACRGGDSAPPQARGPAGRASPRASVRPTGEPTFAIEPITRTPTPPPTPPPQICLVTRDKGVDATYIPPDLVNLPATVCVPGRTVVMREQTVEPLAQLVEAARREGLQLQALSGYRSYEEQQAVLNQEIARFGRAQAERQVAPPGHSEHQLGVAVDVVAANDPNDLDQVFGTTPEGRWVAANAIKHGFVISYPADKERITGYIYEPWHIRWVGTQLAGQIAASGLTLTEFLPARGMAGCSI
jgi:zinc D-Ala-D-Ala carboxypeptidase